MATNITSYPVKRKNDKYEFSKLAIESDGDFLLAGKRINDYEDSPYLNAVEEDEVITRSIDLEPIVITKKDSRSNNAIAKEKERIKKQYESYAYNRKDHFSIGTVFLSIPPSNINISHEKNNFRFNHLRNVAETIVSSGHSTIRVDLDVYFNGVDEINNKLRPLLAQYKTTPFLPIENELVRKTINPDSSTNIVKDGDEDIDRMRVIDSKKKKKHNDISDIVLKMRRDNTVDKYLQQEYFLDLNNVPDRLLSENDYMELDDGRKIPGYRKIITRHLKGDVNMASLEGNLKTIDSIQLEIADLDKEATMISKKNIENRFMDEQIVGVLSQITVSTLDDYPETLACRLSLYVFNYKPFTEDFAFVQGYNPDSYTKDINKCDLFIEWYTKRFLNGKTNILTPSLEEIEGDDTSFFKYIYQIDTPVKGSITKKNKIATKIIKIENDVVIKSITISFRNAIKFIPVLSYPYPTCQYLGSYNTDILIKLETNNVDKLNDFTDMVKRFDTTSLLRTTLFRHNYVKFSNELLRLCGINLFVINSFNMSNVQNNPGTYTMTLDMSEYNLLSEESQELKRNKFVIDEEEIRESLLFMMDNAQLFASNKKRTGSFKEYEKFYNLFRTGKNNWFGKAEQRIRSEAIPRMGSTDIFIRAVSNFIFKQEPLKKDRDLSDAFYGDGLYEKPGNKWSRFVNSFEGNENYHYYEDLKKHAVTIIMEDTVSRGEIMDMITNPIDNPELYEFIEDHRNKKENAEKSSGHKLKYFCYPDLQLPAYRDIKNGYKFKNSFRDYGIPPGSYNPYKSPQSNIAEVDPDFFFYRKRIWKNIDDNPATTKGVNNSINMFQNMISKSHHKAKESLTQKEFIKRIEMDEKTYNEKYNSNTPEIIDPDSMNDDGETIIREPMHKEQKEAIKKGNKPNSNLFNKYTKYLTAAWVALQSVPFLTIPTEQHKLGEKAIEDKEEIVGIAEESWTEWSDDEMEESAKNPDSNIKNASRSVSVGVGETPRHRFDRSSRGYLNVISKKIRESQKDDISRMSRAFPTFKFYFVDQDSPSIRKWSDPYEFNAIESIDIVRSRKNAADEAIVKFINTKGNLSNHTYEYYDKEGKPIYEERLDKPGERSQEMLEEQQIEGFMVKSGTDVQIRMGYSSDPDLLDVVFTGSVAEVEIGDVITTVIQGHGRELLNTIDKPFIKTTHGAAYKILGKLLRHKSIEHFGAKVFLKDSDVSTVMGRKVKRDVVNKSKWDLGSILRNMAGFFYNLFGNYQQDDNFLLSEKSRVQTGLEGCSTNFITQDSTIWDAFQDMTRRMTGYVAYALPFDYHATLFFGPPDMPYRYTELRRSKRREIVLSEELTSQGRKKEIERVKGKTKKATERDIGKLLALFNRHLNNYVNSAEGQGKGKREKEVDIIHDALTQSSSNRKIPYLPSSRPYWNPGRVDEAKTIMKSSLISDLDENKEEDRKTKLAIDMVGSAMEGGSDSAIFRGIKKSNGKYKVDVDIDDYESLDLIKMEDGRIIPEEVVKDEFDDFRSNRYDNNMPEHKLFRQYHYKDSFHHIVSNSITASREYMANKIILGWANEQTWLKNGELIRHPPKLKEMLIQLNRNIYNSAIIPRRIVEKNARSPVWAWQYGVSNLWLALKEMYQGTLTILGDPSIKPYDVLFLSDYYNDMYGAIEVESVVHHFSYDTGFVTNITPDLLCHANNIQTKGLVVIANSWMHPLMQEIMAEKRKWNWIGLGRIAENVLFSANKWALGRREPMTFCPLFYKKIPFLAGVEGMKHANLVQFIDDRWSREWRDLSAAGKQATDAVSRKAYYHLMSR